MKSTRFVSLGNSEENMKKKKSKGSSTTERQFTFELSEQEEVLAKSKSKGRTPHAFLESILRRALREPSKKGAPSRPKKPAAIDQPILVIGPFDSQRTTMAALNAKVEAANLRSAILNEIMTSTDRAAGIVGGAFVEEGVEKLIKACWRSDADDSRAGKEQSRVFHPSGPLGSFSVKIGVAYLARMIGPRTFDDLMSIKEIRNKFAHSMTMDASKKRFESVSFDHLDISTLCDRLKCSRDSEIEFADGTRLGPTTPRNKFVLTVMELGGQLHGCAELILQAMPPDHLPQYFP